MKPLSNRILEGLKRGVRAFNKRLSLLDRIVLIGISPFIAIVLIAVIASVISDRRRELNMQSLSSTTHLRLARVACGQTTLVSIAICYSPNEAEDHLKRIPSSAPEFTDASVLLATVRQQIQIQAERSQQEANKVEPGKKQARRDEDAQIHSYLPNTERVDTDMDSSWLADEERTCQTSPDDKGKISFVACNPTGSHRDHNIPVEFWGGTERNTVSDWKCHREKNLLRDRFICKAIN